MANEVGTHKIKVYYDAAGEGTWTHIVNVDSFPDLGGSKDKIEVTNLSDTCHRYIDGIENYGDTLTFTAFYDKAEFDAVSALEGIVNWKVEITLDGSEKAECTFSGSCNTVLAGGGVGEGVKYNIDITPNSAMVWA